MNSGTNILLTKYSQLKNLAYYYKEHGLVDTYRMILRHLESRTIQDQRTIVILFLLTHWAIPSFRPTIIWPSDGMFRAKNLASGDQFWFATLPHEVELYQVSHDYTANMYKKYTLDGFVEVNEGETVVDVGAYVGGFTLSTVHKASSVVAIEPSSRTIEALRRNTSGWANVATHQYVVHEKSDQVKLKLGRDDTDNSIIGIDGQKMDKTEQVDAVRLDGPVLDLPSTIDFLKIDAEGAEPEVLRGAEELEVRKVAVDCSAERFGDKTIEETKELLSDRGYDIETETSMVYGILCQ